MNKERFKSIICVDAFVMKKNQILLMKRKNTGSNDGEYELPGGHLEPGEDLKDAMIRELEEELKISVPREELQLIHIMHHYHGERINFIFKVNGEKRNPIIGEPDKCSELIWTSMKKIPKETTDKVKQILKNVENHVFYDVL